MICGNQCWNPTFRAGFSWWPQSWVRPGWLPCWSRPAAQSDPRRHAAALRWTHGGSLRMGADRGTGRGTPDGGSTGIRKVSDFIDEYSSIFLTTSSLGQNFLLSLAFYTHFQSCKLRAFYANFRFALCSRCEDTLSRWKSRKISIDVIGIETPLVT